ncbi:MULTISPECIES: RNA polymerase sigma factor [Olivibacter]|uniref:RNA polymerase sigma factor n=2 Tax=Olivibacter TaxID=376469 RepID=A0ABV6HMK1_9SPHI|nr:MULTISPECIES: sigma-70 family RNA polymerase sigma factor [Olivibacter]MDM8173040.1 sigma-70 family RNA polymerase sigma factor [Olivibacter sp. 47]QEL02827.1 sigma-70 family RNA polymerase sigma factor [Olivibacter sp. LS-1]
MSNFSKENELSHLFRSEYTKMTAVLCRHFGLVNLEIAEDIVSDAFLKAAEYWGVNGIPDNPAAWLYTVAKNKAKDFIKRDTLFQSKRNTIKELSESFIASDSLIERQYIADSVLAMMFAVCDSHNSPESQICLALQILSGFSVEELAQAFLTKTETIKKRLYRARNNLRKIKFRINELNEQEIKARSETVLKVLYLLYNEGYYSKSNSQIIRKDLCAEAIRLALLLLENQITNTAQANALMALMCYQSSRLDARMNEHGEPLRFDEQDRERWDSSLIERGHYYMLEACHGNEMSSYHLEASIAYWHTTLHKEKWNNILDLYDQLLQLAPTPPRTLNRFFAYGKVYGHEKAIEELEKTGLTQHEGWHELLGYLYASINKDRAIEHYQKAINKKQSPAAKEQLMKEIIRLRAKLPILRAPK